MKIFTKEQLNLIELEKRYLEEYNKLLEFNPLRYNAEKYLVIQKFRKFLKTSINSFSEGQKGLYFIFSINDVFESPQSSEEFLNNRYWKLDKDNDVMYCSEFANGAHFDALEEKWIKE